ncbi:MAG: hypothetical protein HY738_06115 [Bacteroidia bacterium]|nr:hypothetical protein [Bacteroidia bacterium]
MYKIQIKYIIFLSVALIFYTSIQAQSLCLINSKGRILKTIHQDEYVYFKLMPSVNLEIPVTDIDTIYKITGKRKNVQTPISFNRKIDYFSINSFTARIMQIKDKTLSIIPVQFDSLKSDDIRKIPDMTYKLALQRNASYYNLDINKIRMIYITPIWRTGLYMVTGILGMAIMVAGPLVSVDIETYKPDFLRMGYISGAGLALFIFCKINRMQMLKKTGYFTTVPDDRVSISRKYKAVFLDIR